MLIGRMGGVAPLNGPNFTRYLETFDQFARSRPPSIPVADPGFPRGVLVLLKLY